jgi:beta-glucanase (GH16 family)
MVSAAPAGWNPVWNDEFDTLDLTKWTRINTNHTTNNSLQDYLPQQVTVSAGNLVITSENISSRGLPYRSGQVISTMERQYGRWEVRAQLPTSTGMWPAIWLLPRTNVNPWPSQGEIDIMENRGDQPNLTSSAFHYGTNPPYVHNFDYREQRSSTAGQLENYHNSFHTYAVEWDSSKLRFFVDDVHYYTVTDDEVGEFLSSQSAQMQTIINTAIGGDFLTNPDGSTVWPQQMLVDYVRVYERDATPPPVVFQNGSFEDQGGSMAGWSTFGNVLIDGAKTNVAAHSEAVLDGGSSLKIFGQFNGGQNFSGVTQGISVSPGDTVSASANALVRALDDLVGSNVVEMKFDYYNEFGGKFDTPAYLESELVVIANASTPNDTWINHVLTDTAPAGAVEARLAFVFNQPASDGGAIHLDDVSFTNLDLQFNADADGDGNVDGADFLSWQRGLGLNDGTTVADGDFNYDGRVDANDLAVWRTQLGVSLSTMAAATSVPEPASLWLLISCLGSLFFSHTLPPSRWV